MSLSFATDVVGLNSNTTMLMAVNIGSYCFISLMALAIISFLLWFLVRFYYWYISPLHDLPGEKGSFWLGVLPQIIREGFMGAEIRWWKENGQYDVKLIHQPHWLGASYVLVLDKEIVHTILTAPEGKNGQAPRFRTPRDTFRVFLGKGLLTLEGDAWRRHRRIIEPSFNGKLLEETLTASVPPIVNAMVELWNEYAADTGREINVNSHFSASTLDVLGNVTLSHDFGGIKAIADWAIKKGNTSNAQLESLTDKFVIAVVNIVRFSIIGAICFVLEPPCYIQDLLLQLSKTLRQGRYQMKQQANNIIANAKKNNTEQVSNVNNNNVQPIQGNNTSNNNSISTNTSSNNKRNQNNNNNNTRSILQLMLKAQQKEGDKAINNSNGGRTLNHLEIRDEVVLFFMAGHETTAAWLYWCMYALVQYPNIQEKVYQDIITHCHVNTKEIGINETSKMLYLNGFLHEVLRLYSPVPRISRVTTQTETLAGQIIPKGTRLLIYSYLLHRSPLYWDKPELFQPERWINVTNDEVNRRRFAFLPFSYGSRSCIGQRFATLEAQMMVAAIVRAFHIQMAPSQCETKFNFISLVTVKTNPELKIIVKKR